MNQIKSFISKYSITTHSVAALFAAAVLAYSQVPAFHDLVLGIYNSLPKNTDKVILAALGLYTWYRNGETVNLPQPPKQLSWYQQQKNK